MHINYEIYYFIDSFNYKDLSNINKRINIIYRNYSKKNDLNDLNRVKEICKKKGLKLFISNNLKLALKLDLDGLYLPSFNKKLKYKNIACKKKFKLIGSAHNTSEINIKNRQGCSKIFISPIFKTPKHKNHLDTIKFNLLSSNIKNKVIALGGINSSNFFRIRLTLCKGFASISWIKKNGLNKI